MELSIIVPVYNTFEYLEKCIESLIQETSYEYEIILIDDGSTDGSGLLCDELSNKYDNIKVIHKKNEGVSVARNMGIDMASGKWIMFVDSDDYITDTSIQLTLDSVDGIDTDMLMWSYLNNENNVMTKQQLFNDNVTFIGNEAKELSKLVFFNYGMQPLWNPVCKLYKLQIIKDNNIRYEKGISVGEDVLFIYDYLCQINSAMYINEFLYIREIREESAIRVYNENKWKSIILYLEQFKKRIKNWKSNDELVQFFLLRVNAVDISVALFSSFFHKNNTDSLKLQRKKAKEFLKQPLVNEAIKNIDVFKVKRKADFIKIIMLKLRCTLILQKIYLR